MKLEIKRLTENNDLTFDQIDVLTKMANLYIIKKENDLFEQYGYKMYDSKMAIAFKEKIDLNFPNEVKCSNLVVRINEHDAILVVFVFKSLKNTWLSNKDVKRIFENEELEHQRLYRKVADKMGYGLFSFGIHNLSKMKDAMTDIKIDEELNGIK